MLIQAEQLWTHHSLLMSGYICTSSIKTHLNTKPENDRRDITTHPHVLYLLAHTHTRTLTDCILLTHTAAYCCIFSELSWNWNAFSWVKAHMPLPRLYSLTVSFLKLENRPRGLQFSIGIEGKKQSGSPAGSRFNPNKLAEDVFASQRERHCVWILPFEWSLASGWVVFWLQSVIKVSQFLIFHS